jgi:hypothetical protein
VKVSCGLVATNALLVSYSWIVGNKRKTPKSSGQVLVNGVLGNLLSARTIRPVSRHVQSVGTVAAALQGVRPALIYTLRRILNSCYQHALEVSHEERTRRRNLYPGWSPRQRTANLMRAAAHYKVDASKIAAQSHS